VLKTDSLIDFSGTVREATRNGGGVNRFVLSIGLSSGVLAALIWSYWSTIVDLVEEWNENQDYSVGQLVPLVAIYLVWYERKNLRQSRVDPFWWGIVIILTALAIRIYGLFFLLQSAERYSLVILIAGLVLLLAGRDVFGCIKWIFLFLFLMVPLPGRLHNAISSPLQSQATAGAVFLLETFGVSVVQEGNIIRLNGTTPVAVAEACSGLRMLTAFVVVSATLAYIVRRPRWQKIVLLLSSIPVAIVCNLLRLCGTAQLFLAANSQTAERFFHDFAGLTMMPLAVFILIGELALMKKIAPEEASSVNLPSGKVRVVQAHESKNTVRK